MDPQPVKAFRNGFQKFAFSASDQTLFKDFLPSVAKTGRPKHPDQNIQVSKAARGFFNVRFQSIRGLVVLQMPLLLFDEFCPIELFKIQTPLHRIGVGLKEFCVPRDEPGFEHRGLCSDVDICLFKTLFDFPNRVADGQTKRP